MQLRTFIFFLLSALAVSIKPALAQDSSTLHSFTYTILAGSRVTVIGSTNVNEFACASEKTIYDHRLSLFTTPGLKTITFRNAVLQVKTESLDCGNAVMNTNLCATMHGDEFPYIIVELAEVQSTDGKPIRAGSGKIIAKSYITLAGKKKLNTVSVEAIKNSDGTYRFSGKHQISLSSYGLEPPRAFFGLIKVHDEITVQFDLLVSVRESALQ